MTSLFLRFIDHTQQCTTVGRTPLNEWSACHRDLYLTTHNTNTSGIRTHDPSRWAAADPHLRPRCHWYQRYGQVHSVIIMSWVECNIRGTVLCPVSSADANVTVWVGWKGQMKHSFVDSDSLCHSGFCHVTVWMCATVALVTGSKYLCVI
jgi:hypothetical protein